VVEIEPDWWTRLLEVLTDPNVAYILLLVGVSGLIFEVSYRDIFAPGAIGSIGLVLGLAALNFAPMNMAGTGLTLSSTRFKQFTTVGAIMASASEPWRNFNKL